MKKLLLIGIFSLPLLVNAQFYKSVLGIKLGYPGLAGINNKTFLAMRYAVDNTLQVNFDKQNRYIGLQSLVEFNRSFGLNPGYNWYAGVGPRLNYYLSGGYLADDGLTSYSGLLIKADGVFGLEYTAPKTSINAAIEGGPSVYVYPFVKFGGYAQISVRWVIARGGFKRRVH